MKKTTILLFLIAPALIALKEIPFFVSLANIAMLSGLASALLYVRHIHQNKNIAIRFLIIILILMVTGLIICDAANYRIKGEPANYYFWEMLSWATVSVYLLAFPGLLLLCAAILIMPIAAMVVACREPITITKTRTNSVFILLIFLASIVGESSPRHMMASYFANAKWRKIINDINKFPPNFVTRDNVKAVAGKNIVWIYVESLNQAFTDSLRFPELMPYLAGLAETGLSFQSLLQLPGQQGTNTGMMASQCGRFSIPQKKSAPYPYPYDVCLGNILKQAGYNQVFLKGADLAFEDFGSMLHSWEFDEVFGKLEIDAAYPQYINNKIGWGYEDSSIFDLAYQKYVELSQKEKPFHLVMLTVNAHDGTYNRDICSGNSPYFGPAKDNEIVQSFHCTDLNIKKFIKDISQLPAFSKTIVVIIGDHIMHNPLLQLSKDIDDRDRIFGLILNAGKVRKIYEPTTHMDFAPTVLSLAGVQTNATFLDGRDLAEGKESSRQINFATLSREEKGEFRGTREGNLKFRKVIYNQSVLDVSLYLNEQHQAPTIEKDGILVYRLETHSYNNRTNILILLKSKDCARLTGLPYIQYSTPQEQDASVDFSVPDAAARQQDDGVCARLLSFNVLSATIITSMQVGLKNDSGVLWRTEL